MLDALAHRGPDGRGVTTVGEYTLGHVRLAIRDPSSAGAQPMTRGHVTVSFNGELYNDQVLARDVPVLTSGADTEVLAWTLNGWPADEVLRHVDGMLAVAWVDVRDGALRLARDRYGEAPLHYGLCQRRLVFASEVTALLAVGTDPRTIRWLPPGCVATFRPGQAARVGPYAILDASPVADGYETALEEVATRMAVAVRSRLVSDMPVALLLSGGLDSTVVAAHARGTCKTAYTAVLDKRSRDLRHARLAATELGLDLVEVPVPPPSADDLARTLRVIEMPHKAQIEIAWACLQLAQRARADGFRVVLSGEGSDELWASYGTSYHGVMQQGWAKYRATTLLGQHRKNFPRCNKVFLRHGVECRLPYLAPTLVSYAIRLQARAVSRVGRAGRKDVLADAHRGFVPAPIRRRAKEAFQTAAGIDSAAAKAVADPKRFYTVEYARAFQYTPTGKPSDLHGLIRL